MAIMDFKGKISKKYERLSFIKLTTIPNTLGKLNIKCIGQDKEKFDSLRPTKRKNRHSLTV